MLRVLVFFLSPLFPRHPRTLAQDIKEPLPHVERRGTLVALHNPFSISCWMDTRLRLYRNSQCAFPHELYSPFFYSSFLNLVLAFL